MLPATPAAAARRPGDRPWLALAGQSVRALAEAAVAEGFEVLAADLFGDADTRRVARGWRRLGDPAGGRFDAAVLHALLRDAAAAGAVGWLAGGGFEAQAGLLDAGGSLLPLLGTAPADQRRLRDAATFFAALAAAELPHPEVAWQRPADAGQWLVKTLRGCGGEQVRGWRAGESALPPGHFTQRRVDGVPMSATFVADGRQAELLGFNRLRVQRGGERPYLFAGAVGPLAVPPAVEAVARRALQHLVPAFGLRGLGSLDLLVTGDGPSARALVLELNARPPATLALYPQAGPLRRHLAACGVVLPPPGRAVAVDAVAAVRAFEVLRVDHAVTVDAALAEALAGMDGTHDLPHAGDTMTTGAPLCSISASGPTEAAALALLARRRERIHHLLEATCP